MAQDGESNERRRKVDIEVGKFIGEIDQWKEESILWRRQTDEKLKEIHDFMQEIRTPRKIIVWAVRAFFIAAIGGFATACVSYIKGHIQIN